MKYVIENKYTFVNRSIEWNRNLPGKDAVLSTIDYQAIYMRCRKRLTALAAKSLPCERDAEDAFADAFARFFQRDLSDKTEEEAEYYLIRCVLNAVSDFWRRAKNCNETEFEECFYIPCSQASPWERLMHSEDRRRLILAVSQLPERQRRAIWLRYFGEHELNDIAAIMECNPSTVRSLIHNAIQKLKEGRLCATAERNHES